jgi:putative ABC transport system substrate-binding protein
MKRRDFIALLGGTVVVRPLAARAQQPRKVARVGFLGAASATNYANQLSGLRQGLADLGYIEGTTIVIEYRWAEGKIARLPELAVELVRSNVDLIVTHGTPGTLAAKQATATIPIVMATSGDAEASGLVASLARPGGNVTGLTFFNPELAAKRCELLKESLPGLTEVGLLLNPANPINEPIVPMIKLTAQTLGLEVYPFGVRDPAEFEGAFAAMVAKRVGAVVIIDDATLIANAPVVASLALRQRLPSSGWPDYAIAGGVIGYGVNFPDLFRSAATFVDKILKGAKPADLPVERATKFRTTINLKTAKALGLDVPTATLLRADEVIE